MAGVSALAGGVDDAAGKKLIVHRMRVCSGEGAAGEIRVEDGRMLVGCVGGMLEFEEVQMEGKKRMAASEFLRGFQVKTGERVGS